MADVSSEPVTMNSKSVVAATHKIGKPWPIIVFRFLPPNAFHVLPVHPSPPVARIMAVWSPTMYELDACIIERVPPWDTTLRSPESPTPFCQSGYMEVSG